MIPGGIVAQELDKAFEDKRLELFKKLRKEVGPSWDAWRAACKCPLFEHTDDCQAQLWERIDQHFKRLDEYKEACRALYLRIYGEKAYQELLNTSDKFKLWERLYKVMP